MTLADEPSQETRLERPTPASVWLRRGLLFVSLPVLLVAVGGLWLAATVLSYHQDDDAAHMASKEHYLRKIAASPSAAVTALRPNIVFVLFDDLGYGDLGHTGSQAIETPAMDRLAADGVVLSRFYSPSPVCSPARAGFLTGRFPPRAGVPSVVFPTGSAKSLINIAVGDPVRIPAEEVLLPEVLRAAGYATGMVGKWHLGDRSPSLPNERGFDEYFGALYSNDMEPFALYRNGRVSVEAPADQSQLNRRYVAAATAFIDEHGDAPFFLYYAHNFPHRPRSADPAQRGRSAAGLYGDVVEGLDWGVAQLVAALEARGVYDDTLIIVTSDNGPWYEGSPGPLRGRKGETFEGGMRVPFVAHWPGRLRAGRRLDGISMGTDLFPTLMDWLDLPLPADRIIDGKSIREMLERGTDSPHDYLYYFAHERLMALRDDRYKYHERRTVIYGPEPIGFGYGTSHGPWLFDMELDPSESYDVSMTRTAQAARMREALIRKRAELEDNPRGWLD